MSCCSSANKTNTSCCNTTGGSTFSTADATSEEKKEIVKQRYGNIAKSEEISKSEGAKLVAQSFGYSIEDLESIPKEANLGLSCGNPVALASLKPGEVVVDLGSGGGIDCFLAAARVGKTGKVIGIDMTQEMIDLANANNQKRKQNDGNVQFVLGDIENIPLPSEFADVVISNCVINLVPDKKKAYQEIYRILKPGGRMAISDIALKKEVPEQWKSMIAAYTGCITGALLITEAEKLIKEAGFRHLDIVDSHADLNAYSQMEGASCCNAPTSTSEKPCCSPSSSAKDGPCCSSSAKTSNGSCCSLTSSPKSPLGADFLDLLSKININDYAASVKFFAVK